VTEAMKKQADNVRESLGKTVDRLFLPIPLGFTPETFINLYHDILGLPVRIPEFISHIAEETRLLGLLGSLLILLFVAGLIYTLVVRKKIFNALESFLLPFTSRTTKNIQPVVEMVLRLVANLIVPLIFWFMYWLIQAFTGLQKPWFQLIGHLIVIWAAGVGFLLINTELFKKQLIPIPAQYSTSIYRFLRIITLYTVFTMLLFYIAEAFQLNPEYLALLKVILSLTVVLATLTLVARKKEILSLLPDLPYNIYRFFREILTKLYTPAMLGTFLTGVLWCFGYRDLCWFIWIKTWAVAAVIVSIGVCYHYLTLLLERLRSNSKEPKEIVAFFYNGLSMGLKFMVILTLIHSLLSLFGIYEPMKRLISFPIFVIGDTPISLWSFVRAFLIIWIFHLASRILRGYFDFKVFPVLKIEQGLAYSINTFIGYLLIITGALFAMHSVGLDLRILLFFAGAIGIGIGFGLQNMAANIISGFFLIFGQKIRKGDWIKVSDTIGHVTEVSLQLTKVITRDNVEYLIPNADLTSNMIINYSLTEPLIRVHVPVGVSYDADPKVVRDILIEQALLNKHISRHRKPTVWFQEYGDSSINFSLLVWIDVRKISEPEVRSELYFSIFNALAEKNIEIPFPQRDVHIIPET